MRRSRLLIFAVFILAAFGCSRNFTPEQKAYAKNIEIFRDEKNVSMREEPSSPFNFKGKVEFHDLKYFDVDPDFVFKSKLTEYNPKDTVTIYGTKGEARTAVRFGYVVFTYKSKDYKVNVYEGSSKNGEKYYSIWFTDLTTNKESYGVGRYIDFEKSDDPDYIYTIDFNLAYNPYCAYSPNYSCAVPTKEDFIPLEIKAGEKKFHD